ncbi:hypothetical protein OROHE_025879 [Orobanche hederae]
MANDKLQYFCILIVVLAALYLVEIEGQDTFEIHKEVGCHVCGAPNYSNDNVTECHTCCDELFPGRNVGAQWGEISDPTNPNALPYCVCGARQDPKNYKKCKSNLT